MYPPLARRGLRAAVAAVLGFGSAAAGAQPASGAEPVAAPAPRPPRVAPSTATEPLDWPVRDAGSAPRSQPRPEVQRQQASMAVVVRPGDCLWSITAHALGPRATPDVVAVEWPRWWSANREAIGDDPGLLRPGLHLHPPAVSERSPS